MKLSTKLKKYLWNGYFTGWGGTTKNVTLLVDCKEVGMSSNSLEQLDEWHRQLTKERGCKLLPLNECPVVNDHEIIMHYTSTTYKDWCNVGG